MTKEHDVCRPLQAVDVVLPEYLLFRHVLHPARPSEMIFTHLFFFWESEPMSLSELLYDNDGSDVKFGSGVFTT